MNKKQFYKKKRKAIQKVLKKTYLALVKIRDSELSEFNKALATYVQINQADFQVSILRACCYRGKGDHGSLQIKK